MEREATRQAGAQRPLVAKAAYSRAASKKLLETRAKLDSVSIGIRQAIATGRLSSSDKLELAQQAVAANLAVAEERLEKLRKSGDAGWESLRDDVEDAWEDLSASVKTLVSRFSDEVKS